MQTGRIARISMLAVMVAALLSPGLPAQDQSMSDDMAARMKAWEKAGAVGEHHEHLKLFEGKWEASGRVFYAPDTEAVSSRGWSMNKMSLNGRYLQQDYAAEMSGGKYRGLGYLGYDNTSGKHTAIWMDDASTMALHFEGTCSGEGKRIEMSAEHLDPVTGKPSRSRGVLVMKSRTLFSYEGFTQGPDGEEFKNLEIVYRKREE